jgi:CDP-diacylglycerol---serine O-phosphatidyltransferase
MRAAALLQSCASGRAELNCFAMPSDSRRHFSMLREFRAADFFTLANGFAGCGAILAFMRFCADGQPNAFWMGTALMPVALVMDILDGRVARLRNEASPLGQELDSLADVVSFGVAPAAMAFACGLRGEGDALCLMYFVACGISRLARYNVTAASLAAGTGKVRYFEGMPIPSSLLLVLLLAVLFGLGYRDSELPLSVWRLGPVSLHPLALLFVAHGSAMISKTLRIPKL